MTLEAGGRIGFFGGTFDPIHLGHRVVAQDVLEALELDRLLIVPAGRPPHRQAVLPARIRFDLVRRSFAGDERLEVSELELDREGPSYTVDTLARIRERRRPDRLFCVIGADQARELDTWHRPGRIARLSELAVMTRSGGRLDPEELPMDVEFRNVPVTRIELSSTRVRERLRAGRSIRYLVPDAIRRDVERAWMAASGD